MKPKKNRTSLNNINKATIRSIDSENKGLQDESHK